MTNHDGNRNGVGKHDDPAKRIGIYKSLDMVPTRYRFEIHAAKFEGRDVWAKWAAQELESNTSDRFRENLERVERYWKDHMGEQDRHHALARPEDVEAFFADLLDRMKVNSAYLPYWIQIRKFYEWLQWHTKYPHIYQPVLMAAVNYDAARELFDYQVSRGNY